MDRTIWNPYCGIAPAPAEWWLRWNFDPALLFALCMATVLWLGFVRGGAGAAQQGASFGSWAADRASNRAAAGALVLFAALFVSPLCALGSALFLARVIHHVLLAVALAPLIVEALALHRARRPGGLPGSLALWTALQALVFWGWHAPPLYAAALSSDGLFWVMQITITGSSAIWWAKLLRASVAGAVTALLATMVQMGLLGALITFAGRALYAPHWLTTQPWGMTPLEDQQLAGITMWAPASAFYLLAAMLILFRSLRADPRDPAVLGPAPRC